MNYKEKVKFMESKQSNVINNKKEKSTQTSEIFRSFGKENYYEELGNNSLHFVQNNMVDKLLYSDKKSGASFSIGSETITKKVGIPPLSPYLGDLKSKMLAQRQNENTGEYQKNLPINNLAEKRKEFKQNSAKDILKKKLKNISKSSLEKNLVENLSFSNVDGRNVLNTSE